MSPSITILNVDDHEISRYSKSRVLRRAGFEVKEAITGHQALQVIRQEHPPVVLLDIHLPDIDGLEVCRRIKTDPDLASTLVLQISASSVTSRDRVRGLEGGADIYMTEPVEPDELVAQVRALLRIYQAEQALARLNETLEQRVRERTALLQLLHEILAAVNRMETVEEALHFALDQICTYTRWPVGHVYWLNRQHPDELISSTLWHLDDPERFEPFRQATEATTLAMGVDLPGQVLASGELKWVGDLAQLHPQRAPAALQSGLQIGFGFPLWVDQEIVAVLEFYTTEAVELEGTFLEVMAQIGAQLGRVVERRRAEDQLRRLNAELEQRVSQRTAQLEAINQEIRRVNERFAVAEEAVQGFVYEYDQETGLVERSHNFTTVTGYEPHEAEPTIEWWISLLHPDDRERVISAFLKTAQESDIQALEYRVRHRDGHYIYLWDQCRIVRNEAGQVKRLIGTAIDISERKQMEETLLESEARFRTMADVSPVIIWVTVAEGGIEFVNRAYLDFFGVTLAEIQGPTGWQPLVHPDDAEAYIGEFEAALRERRPFHAQARVRHASGEWRWIASYAAPRFSPSGEFLGYVGSSPDITGMKLAQEALRESEERFRVAQELSLYGFTVLKAVRNPAGQIVDFVWEYVNSATERILHRSKEDLVGRRLLEVLPGHKSEGDLFDHYVRVVETGQPHDIELAYNADGIKGWFRNMTIKLGDGVAISFSDITQHKRAQLGERLLAEAGKILTSSLDYTVQLSNIAHLVVPHLADWCAVDLYDEDWTVHPVTVAHVDPAKVELLNKMRRRYPPNWENLREEARLWQKGQARLYPDITEAMLEASAQDAEHYQLLHDLQLRSAMVVPMLGRERVLGLLTFVLIESGNCYDEQDLALAEELAYRIALVLDNTYAYAAEQQARQAAEEATERTVALQMVTAALSRALTSQQIFEVIVQHGLSVLRADSGAVMLMNEDGTALKSAGFIGYPEAIIKTFETHPLSRNSMLSDAVHTGQPVWIRSHAEYMARYPHLASVRAASQIEASAVAPLLVESQVLGVIALSFAEVHDFKPEEKDFVVTLAGLCAQALERARLYEVEQQARAEAEANQQRLALLAEMRERNRLAQELHDTVAQALGYLNLKLSMMNALLLDQQLDLVKADLQELKKVVDETYTDVREEIFFLRAKALSDLGFMELLKRYVDKYRRFYNLDIQLIQEADPALFEFTAEATSQLIRTIQEALINIRKHSHVNTATIRLGCQEEAQICMVIEDHGAGFDLTQIKGKTSSFGLQIMRERVESVGGSMEIDTAPGQGTRIILRYPHKREG